MATPDAGPALQPSALSQAIKTSSLEKGSSPHSPHLHHLTAHIHHNLQYQHDWTALDIHTHSALAPSHALSRPLISGLPPQRIYIHPDEQIELLKKGDKEAQTAPEREWVLPTHVRETWTPHRLMDIFDAMTPEPPGDNSRSKSTWPRRRKRLLLATLNDDSTVVYYILHEGIVKPRQN
ncbi:MAG: hypothetical protein M1838_006126 [Thelocarpon superellum]|nr:MAG: hypothetical protein M1838_006126 [Thelocarpon superellum]